MIQKYFCMTLWQLSKSAHDSNGAKIITLDYEGMHYYEIF